MNLTILDGILFGMGFTLGSFVLALPLTFLAVLLGPKNEH